MTERDAYLATLAAAVLDGTPIDWPAPDAGVPEADRPLIDQLRLLSAIADTHRHYREPAPSAHADGPAASVDDRAPHWGRLRVLDRIGGGAYGEVYRAWDPRLEREVALKLIPVPPGADQTWATSVISEGRRLARVRHAGVATIHDAEQIGQCVGLTMEYLRGRTLEKRVAEEGPLDSGEAVAMLVQVCRALHAVHEAGVVHRDVKASNVIETVEGRVVLVDFGTGHERGAEPPGFAGTPLYLAPEILQGRPATAKSDVYSAGVLLYHLLTGSYPVSAASLPELRAAHERGPLGRSIDGQLAGLSPALVAALDTALSPDPDRRPASAGELADRLEAVSRPGRARNMVLRASAVAAAMVLLAAGLAARSWMRPTEPSPATAETVPRASPQALAVLPFVDLKPSADTSYLSFSLADALITRLSHLGALDVRAASSVYKYRDAPPALAQAAADLRVGRLITGTYRQDGETLRVAAEMVDAVNNVLLYRESFDVPRERLATLSDQVARQVVDALHMSVSPHENAAWQAETVRDPVAYELFLRGRDDYEATRRSHGVAFFQRAVAIDPSFARAWTFLGSAYAINASLRFGGRAEYARARHAFETAIRLDPSNARPRVQMADLLTESNRVEEAVALLRGALEHSPRNADALWGLGYAYRFAGLLDESLAAHQRSGAIDPFMLGGGNLMIADLYKGEYQRFLDSFKLDAQSAYQTFYAGFARYHLRQFADAARAFDEAFAMDGTMLQARVGKVLSYLIAGDRAAAARLLRSTELQSTEREVTDAEGLFRIAQAYAVIGNSSSALRLLERSIDGGFFCVPYFERDPLLESIRTEPEYRRLLERARLRHEAFKQRFFPVQAPR